MFEYDVRRASRRPGSGEARELQLELRVLADVVCSGCRTRQVHPDPGDIERAAQVADYPFTTLHPTLAVVRVDIHRSFVVADIRG